MNEVWKDINGFEGLYQVSNLGRVKALEKEVERYFTRYNKWSNYIQPEKIRALSPTRGGYLFMPLSKDGKQFPKRVHRLVAEAFCEGYSEECDVHHIDGDITNNRADNLECLDPGEHAKRHLGRLIIGTNGKVALAFRHAEIKEYGFDEANVLRCCKCADLPDGDPRKTKYATHKGWRWKYAE